MSFTKSVEQYAIFQLDPDGTVVSWNRGAQNLKGYRETDIVGEHFSVFYPEAARAVNWPDRELELAVENDSFEDEGWRVRNDGSRFWAHVNITARFDDEGSLEGFTKVTRDLTERREHELYLRAFREAIEQSRHSIYFTNVDGTIEYVNPAFEVITGYTAEEAIGEDPRFLNADDTTADFYRDLQRTIHGGDVWIGEVVNRRKSGETYTVHQTTAPIKNAENSIERFVTINTDISERKGRERTLRRQRNELERHHQITESLRSLNRVLTRASTRNEAEQLVCDRLASSEAYRFAWIANNGPGNDIVPHTWAGIEDERLSDVTITTDDSDLEHSPAGRALRSGTVHAVQDILSDPTYERWHERAVQCGYRSSAAVPLVYRDTVYGVLVLCSSRPFAFDEHEQHLLQEVGERIGHTIHAAENQRLLHADTVVELEFRCTDPNAVFVEFSERLDCSFSISKLTPTADGAFVSYLEVTDTPPTSVCEHLGRNPSIDDARVLREQGNKGTIECLLSGNSPLLTLTEYGATIRTVEVERGGATLVAEVAPEADTRGIIEGLQREFPGTEFRSKQSTDRPRRNVGTAENLDDRLTDRQWEILEVAYHAGYFNSPRDVTGEELAATLGISSATFYQHIRKGTRKVLAELVTGSDASP